MGGSPRGAAGFPWGFSMVFIGVVVVVVVFVESERWYGLVGVIGLYGPASGVQLYCFCMYFSSSVNIV